MSESASATPDAAPAGGTLIPPHARVQIAILAGLFVALHWDILYRLGRFAASDDDWSHAFILPVISIFFIYLNRDRLARIRPHTSWWGLPIMLVGLFGYFLSIYPVRNDMFKGYFMILELFGLVWFMVGGKMMTVLWFPIFYLAFGVKVSNKIWEFIAFKLQRVAAHTSTGVMRMIGIDASVDGNTIHLWDVPDPPGALNVAEACSGIRSLMMFIMLGVAVAWLVRRPWWSRFALVLLTVPVAITVNVGRVTILGILYRVDPELSRGEFHTFIGMVLLMGPALLMFLGIGWLLDKIVIQDEAVTGSEPAKPPGDPDKRPAS